MDRKPLQVFNKDLIYVIVGFLTTLFLLKDFICSEILPSIKVFDFTITSQNVWFCNVVVFSFCIFLVGIETILFFKTLDVAVRIFYLISIMIFPTYLIICLFNKIQELLNKFEYFVNLFVLVVGIVFFIYVIYKLIKY